MRVKRLVVGKGLTVPTGEYEFLRVHFEVEVEVDRDEEVPTAKEWAESVINGWLQKYTVKAEKPRVQIPPSKPKALSINDVRKRLSQDLLGKLILEQDPAYIFIRPREYLGSDVFRRVADAVRDLGGEYVAAGKDSHFKIPREAKAEEPREEEIPEFNPEELMQHEWKGRKLPDGGYGRGTLSWGWDFADRFSPATIAVLKKGPLKIDKYQFTLDQERNLVYVRKVQEA